MLPQGNLDIAEPEHHAISLHSVEITQIPGLLQTEDHARALFSQVSPGQSQQDIDTRVEFRMRRQQVLDRSSHLTFEVVIHESALRIRAADRRIARAQLRTLIEASERERVCVRVVPFDTDGFSNAGYSMLHIGAQVPQLDSHLDAAHGGVLLVDEDHLNKHRHLYQEIKKHSVNPARSRDFMNKVMLDT
ncbi:DUF5753 domain-containing protein [Streptomyces sp. Ru87]|uniref:DUF5753 domain-containing protein n=1 Tax=Streptomyces sp. Ru87 TaxID=2044307 RepID=UPI00117E848F|nr:DUF5753 domain-containing protein [Streptomyces sp. Ru87]